MHHLHKRTTTISQIFDEICVPFRLKSDLEVTASVLVSCRFVLHGHYVVVHNLGLYVWIDMKYSFVFGVEPFVAAEVRDAVFCGS